MSAPEDEKHVTFSEADDGVGNLRRVPTGGAGELASAAEVAAGAGMDSAVDASTDSLQVRVQNHPSASNASRARFRRTPIARLKRPQCDAERGTRPRAGSALARAVPVAHRTPSST
jgi:hypothetical protein